MISHLIFPSTWVDCEDPENCPKHVHLPETAENLNLYPKAWIETLFSCEITEQAARFYDSNDKTHHDTQPAVVRRNGTKIWYCHGNPHRDNGPAVIWYDGTEEWYDQGVKHRDDGPAVTNPSGQAEWYQNGSPHRVDGPAITNPDGTQEWWIHGVQQTTPDTQGTRIK